MRIHKKSRRKSLWSVGNLRGVLPRVPLLPARHTTGRKSRFSRYISALWFAGEDEIPHSALYQCQNIHQLFICMDHLFSTEQKVQDVLSIVGAELAISHSINALCSCDCRLQRFPKAVTASDEKWSCRFCQNKTTVQAVCARTRADDNNGSGCGQQHCFQTLNWIKTFIDTRSECLPPLQTNIWHVLKQAGCSLAKPCGFRTEKLFWFLQKGFSQANMFSSCLAAQPSPAGRITPHVCATLFLEQTLVTDTSLLFWGKQGMHWPSSTRSRCPQKKRRWVPGEQGPSPLLLWFPGTSDSRSPIRKHHLSHSWLLRQVAEPHFSAIITYVVAMHGRNVCNGC